MPALALLLSGVFGSFIRRQEEWRLTDYDRAPFFSPEYLMSGGCFNVWIKVEDALLVVNNPICSIDHHVS
jgi:hypothetical protein